MRLQLGVFRKGIGKYWAAAFVASVFLASAMAVPARAADNPVRITFLLAYTIGEWNTELRAGAEAAIKDLGFPVKLRVVGPSAFDPPKQALMFQDETQTSPDAIVITDVAPPLFIRPVMAAEKQGIKIAWINSAPASQFYKGFFVSVDPTEIGLTSADIIAKTLTKKLGKPADQIGGDAVLGLCVPGLAILENRIGGTRKGLAAKMPKLTVLPNIQTGPTRETNYVSWSQAIRKYPDARVYLDACEEGQRNIAKLIRDEHLSATSVAQDAPEEVRYAIRDHVIPASVPANYFVQAYLSVYFTAQSIHAGKPMPSGWLKIAPIVIDSSNIRAYIEAWANPMMGLRRFYGDEIKRAVAAATSGQFAPIADYDHPPK